MPMWSAIEGSGATPSLNGWSEAMGPRLRGDDIEDVLSSSARQHLDQPVEILIALIERFHQHPLVLAMGAEVVELAGQPRMTVGGDTGIAQIAAIGGAGAHGRQHHGTGPEFLRQL